MKVLHAIAVMSIGACALGLATAFAEDAYPNRPIKFHRSVRRGRRVGCHGATIRTKARR